MKKGEKRKLGVAKAFGKERKRNIGEKMEKY